MVVVGACIGPVGPPGPPATERSRTVYLVDHGWHTGIVVKRADIPPNLWPESADFPAARFLEVGWGNREFYQARRPTLGLALRAAILPSASVLHVVAFDAPVEAYFPEGEIIEVALSGSGFDELSRFLHASYARDGAGRTVKLGPSLYGHGAFYVATGRYHLLNNCNHWTARALRAAGSPIEPGSALTAAGVMTQARRFGRVIRAGPAAAGGADRAQVQMNNERTLPPNSLLLINPQSTLLDADGSLWRLFHPNGFGGKYWAGNQPGQKFNELMEQARTSLDQKKRRELYTEATKIVHEEKPWRELFQEVILYGASKRVSVKPRADYRLIVAEMTLAGR